MGRIQQFLTGFYEMTFQGKGLFWAVFAGILAVILVYAFAEKIRNLLKGKTRLLLVIPAAILIGAVWMFISACRYIPISDRSAENPVVYGWEQTTNKNYSTLRYEANKKDLQGKTYIQKFDFLEIVDQLTTETKSEHVFSEFTITASDKKTTIVFYPDGHYLLQAPENGVEETGRYSYAEDSNKLEMTSDAGQTFSVAIKTGKLNYVTQAGEKFAFPSSEIKKIKTQFVETEATEYVSQEYTLPSLDGYYTDERTTLTFYPDGTYRFFAMDSQAEESGQYIYRDSTLTMANASGTSAFWKTASEGPLVWLIFALIFAAALVVVFLFNAQIKAFLKKHPMIWLLIPAALLVYFVYVAIGWNIWTSVSDWPEGKLMPSYGWNSDAWKSKASLEKIALEDRDKKADLVLLYKAESLEIDTYEFGIGYTIVEEETQEADQEGETAKVKKKEVLRKDYFYIPVSSFDAQGSGEAGMVFYSENSRAKIAFENDGCFTFTTVSGDYYGERGQYTYQEGNLTLVRTAFIQEGEDAEAEAAAETIQAKVAKAPFSTTFKIPADVFSCSINSDEGTVLEEVSFLSDDNGRAKITFSPDRTFVLEVSENEYQESGTFTYAVQKDDFKVYKYLTVANATGSTAAWKSFVSGFTQYAKMFTGMTGEEFWNAVKNTLLLFLIIPICLLLGMGLALIMDQNLKGTSVFRTLILLPFALSFVVTGLIWQQMFNGNGGILAEFFKLFGIVENINWTGNEIVMFSIMLVMVWQFSGYVAVIFMAAIKNVPTNIINAAKLDGSYMPRVYWKMILPQMKGAMGSCITILAMYALRSFDLIVSLVGYTNNSATTLPIMMYNEAFQKNNFAYAAAISCFLLALVLVLILPLTYLTNRRKR